MADLAGQFAIFAGSYEYKTITVAAEGNVVMNERLDLRPRPERHRP